jgi:hypothetical protein
MLGLRAAARGVERDLPALHVDPDDRRMRRTVVAERRDDAHERVLVEELPFLVLQCCHFPTSCCLHLERR